MYIVTTWIDGTRVRMQVGCDWAAEEVCDKLCDHGLPNVMEVAKAPLERSAEERLAAERLMSMLFAASPTTS